MKRNIRSLIFLLCIFLMSCSGSDTYRGVWNAINADGQKLQIMFDANQFTIIDSTGKPQRFEYTQTGIEIVNSVKTYTLNVKKGGSFKIQFPDADNNNKGIILDEHDSNMMTITKVAGSNNNK